MNHVLLQDVAGAVQFVTESIGNALEVHFAVVGVDAAGQSLVVLASLLPALVGQVDHVRHGGVGQSEGRGTGHGAGHVAHGVADHFAAVDGVLEGRLVVIGSAVLGGGFDAAALVDGDVNDGGTGLHGLHHGFGDQFRGQSAGDEDGTHEEVGVLGGGGDVEGVGGQGLDAAAEEVVDLAQAEEVVFKCSLQLFLWG